LCSTKQQSEKYTNKNLKIKKEWMNERIQLGESAVVENG
jgi:hypothetical protein